MTGSMLILMAAVFAQVPPAPPGGPARDGFRELWTGWSSANGQSLDAEKAALQRLRQEVESADAERRRQLMGQGRTLGEQVGEVVRIGDCAEGERLARRAGDFALVAAVRDHCAVQAAR